MELRPKLREKLQENRHRIFAARTFRQKEKLKARDLEIRDEIREAVRSTLAKPDKELIETEKKVIAKLRKDRIPFETPKMVKRRKAVQTDFFAPTQADLGFEMVDVNKPKRDQIDAQIDFAQRKIDSELAKGSAENVTAIDRLASLVAGWDPYDQNASSSFFDPEWMFNISDGFDVVIGNPPYVEAKKLKDTAALLRGNYECYSGTADLSVYFYERGMKLSADHGTLSYICTNKFFLTGYGKLLRAFLRAHDLFRVLNFEQCEVFEDVLVSSVITMVANQVPSCEKIGFIEFDGLSHDEFIYQFASKSQLLDDYPLCALTEDEWSFADVKSLELKQKIGVDCMPLKDVDGVAIYRGVTTGYNPAFIITDEDAARMCAQDRNCAKVIRRLLQGRHVRKWYYNESGECLLQTGYSLNIPKCCPTVYAHLKLFKNDLVARSDQGENWWNLRACKYYSDFEVSEKVIWALTSDKWAFAYDAGKHYLPSNGYILTSSTIPVKYLLGFLNSRLMHYYFKFIGVMTAGGAYTLKAATIEALPYRKPSCQIEVGVIELVDKILTAKAKDREADTSALEAQIDQIVYKLYGLTEEEIAIVEGRDKTAAEKEETTAVKPPRRREERLPIEALEALHSDDDEELE